MPISNLAEAVTRTSAKAKELGLLAPIVGHVGDGNFHASPLVEKGNAEERARCEEFLTFISDLALELDGTITGEHGIGQGKMRSMEKEHKGSAEVMRAIKRALDPLNILNPGKILTL